MSRLRNFPNRLQVEAIPVFSHPIPHFFLRLLTWPFAAGASNSMIQPRRQRLSAFDLLASPPHRFGGLPPVWLGAFVIVKSGLIHQLNKSDPPRLGQSCKLRLPDTPSATQPNHSAWRGRPRLERRLSFCDIRMPMPASRHRLI